MTKIVKLTNENFSTTLNKAVEALRQGEIVVYPTDTAYALGADFTNKEALKKIFEVKGRVNSKSVSSTYANLDTIEKFHSVSDVVRGYIEKYLPGALTIFIKDPSYKQNIGIRIPDNKFALALSKKLGTPITATSANLSGKETPFSIETVVEQLGKDNPHITIIIDQGKYADKQTSTVIELIDGELAVKREGAVKIK
jgi:L-threonylcarbamoyladenylate synthase